MLRTHEWAPRVLIANSNLVGDWANWPEFRRLEALGLTMYGQMTAGSWIYIGSQGIVQGTYETFAAVAEKLAAARPAGSMGPGLAGTLTITAGLGGMGGAQPLAVTMNGGAVLCIECDPARAERRVATRYLDVLADNLDQAIDLVLHRQAGPEGAVRRGDRQRRRGAAGTAAPRHRGRRRHRPDQRARPARLPADRGGLEDWHDYAAAKPEEFTDRARASMAAHVEAMVGFADAGAEVFDYGNSIRGEAQLGGYQRAFDFPGVRARVHPAAVLRGQGPVPLGRAVR